MSSEKEYPAPGIYFSLCYSINSRAKISIGKCIEIGELRQWQNDPAEWLSITKKPSPSALVQ
jgi:hypothetical protein